MLELIQPLIAGPVIPATIALAILMLWSLLTISLGIGLEVHHGWPFSMHPDIGGDFSSIGNGDSSHSFLELCGEWLGAIILAPAKWLNLSTVPLVVWFGFFAITWWTVSVSLWTTLDQSILGWLHLESTNTNEFPWFVTKLLIARNILFALPLTKFLTHPLQGLFSSTSAIASQSLVGEEAEIWSLEATPESGQAKHKTDGAPLLLNVRTDGHHLEKGTKVWLTHYDPQRRVYLVEPITFTSNNNDSPSDSPSL